MNLNQYQLIAILDDRDVLRRRPFLAFHNIESNPVTFIECLEPGPIDPGMVDEYVRPVSLFDEPVPFLLVEPFDCTFCQDKPPFVKKFSVHTTRLRGRSTGYISGKKPQITSLICEALDTFVRFKTE